MLSTSPLPTCHTVKRIDGSIVCVPTPRYVVCTGAVHAPYKYFDRHLDDIKQRLADTAPATAEAAAAPPVPPPPLFVVCRRGNDSQRAVARLCEAGVAAHAVDVVGGMEGWAQEVDPGFPTY